MAEALEENAATDMTDPAIEARLGASPINDLMYSDSTGLRTAMAKLLPARVRTRIRVFLLPIARSVPPLTLACCRRGAGWGRLVSRTRNSVSSTDTSIRPAER